MAFSLRHQSNGLMLRRVLRRSEPSFCRPSPAPPGCPRGIKMQCDSHMHLVLDGPVPPTMAAHGRGCKWAGIRLLICEVSGASAAGLGSFTCQALARLELPAQALVAARGPPAAARGLGCAQHLQSVMHKSFSARAARRGLCSGNAGPNRQVVQTAVLTPSAAKRGLGCTVELRLDMKGKICGCMLMLAAWQALCFQSPAQHRRQNKAAQTTTSILHAES